MKFQLDYQVQLDEEAVGSAQLSERFDTYKEHLTEPGALNGSILIELNGQQHGADYEEPLLRFAHEWVRKLPWVVGGDTETVPFRNSEHCFAFVPAGEAVEFCLFEGDETEIEEYVIQPTNVGLQSFATESIKLAEQLVEMVRRIDPELLESDEDCKDLVTSLNEGKKAWHDYEIHQRR